MNNEEIKNYANFLNKLSGNELAIIAMISGYYLSQNLTPEQQNSIGNFLEAVGQIMLCIGAQNQNIESINQNKKPFSF